VNLQELETQAHSAVTRLGSWLNGEASPSLTDIGENVKSETRPPSMPVAWNTALLPEAHVRINKLLSYMNAPIDVVEQIRWCCFLTVLATICPSVDPCLLMIMMQASIQEARKLALHSQKHTRRFHDTLLDVEASLNAAMMAALRCFRSIPQSRDEVGTAADIYAGLQREVSGRF
jgi:hypothetical protein